MILCLEITKYSKAVFRSLPRFQLLKTTILRKRHLDDLDVIVIRKSDGESLT